MAMTNMGLSDKIKAELQVYWPTSVPGYEGFFQQFCDAMGKAVVEYIQNNAEVPSSVAVTSVTAVQAGSDVSGPGTGTAMGTVI